jgi:hypothetical protein
MENSREKKSRRGEHLVVSLRVGLLVDGSPGWSGYPSPSRPKYSVLTLPLVIVALKSNSPIYFEVCREDVPRETKNSGHGEERDEQPEGGDGSEGAEHGGSVPGAAVLGDGRPVEHVGLGLGTWRAPWDDGATGGYYLICGLG